MFDTGESEMCFTLNDQNTKFITGQVNKTTEKGKDEDADDYLKMSKKGDTCHVVVDCPPFED